MSQFSRGLIFSSLSTDSVGGTGTRLNAEERRRRVLGDPKRPFGEKTAEQTRADDERNAEIEGNSSRASY